MSGRGASALALVLAALPGAAFAAGGGEHEEGAALSHFVWEFANLLLLAALLFFVARKPVATYLAERRGVVENELESAAKLLSDAESRLAQWNTRADGLEAEVADIKSKALSAAEAEGRRIVANAESVAERIRNEARHTIERETQRARDRLREEAADLAVQMAEEILRQQVDDGDRERLVEEFVSRLDGAADRGAA